MCNFSFIESIYIGLHIQNILLRDEKVIITNRVVTPILFKLNIGLYELFEKKLRLCLPMLMKQTKRIYVVKSPEFHFILIVKHYVQFVY